MINNFKDKGFSAIAIVKENGIQSLKVDHRAKVSHIGSVYWIADMLAVLYGCVMSLFLAEPKNELLDQNIVSTGHACVGVCGRWTSSSRLSRQKTQNLF